MTLALNFHPEQNHCLKKFQGTTTAKEQQSLSDNYIKPLQPQGFISSNLPTTHKSTPTPQTNQTNTTMAKSRNTWGSQSADWRKSNNCSWDLLADEQAGEQPEKLTKHKKRKVKKPAPDTKSTVVDKPEFSLHCPWQEDEPLEKSNPPKESKVTAVAEEEVPDNWDDE